MDDHIRHELDRDASSKRDVNIGTAAIDGLEAVHDEFLLQRDHHVSLEHDP